MDRAQLFLLFSIFVVTGAFVFVSLPGVSEIDLYAQENELLEEGETCQTPSFKGQCEEGLTCRVIEKEFYSNGYCIKDEN
ncbi:MAG: hypothetical protein ACLFPL_00780 [Candidatus Nanoarchaeia archaeon]